MKTLRFFLFLAFSAPFLSATAFATTPAIEFLTAQDLANNDSISGINLYNSGNTTTTVYGLYLRKLAYVTPGDTCDHATTIYPDVANANITAGAVLMPTPVPAGKSAAVGKNYLYNMIFQAEYYIGVIYPSSPPGCALPGCTWGSDTTTYNWCFYLGALGPVYTATGYTANVPPSTDAVANPGLYDYNLINSYVTLGPISCSDQTLTCTVTNQQTQPFSS